MLRVCKSCGCDFEHKPRQAILCQPCKTVKHREYCKRVDYHRNRYKRTAEQDRERHLVRKYGVSLSDYALMLKEQGGRCAICQRAQDRAFDVDHCHATGKVRGLLCTNCNRMVGHAADDSNRLRAAAAYLDAIVPQAGAAFIRAYLGLIEAREVAA